METNIVIVGGGSAGWLTAGLLASEYGQGSGVSVTLVESPDVKTIGVGEGTWPTMRTTLRKIGVSETEFLRECHAAFKQGTRFNAWRINDDADYYYHPFSAPAGYNSINLVPFWQQHQSDRSFTDVVSTQGRLCDEGLSPKQETTPEYAGVVNYGYHLDAGKFAALLQRHCTDNLSVRHILDHVTSVNGQPDADVESISTAQHGDLKADLFIDCTGFASLLIGKHYDVPFIDCKDILFNDTALAAQVPYANDSAPIASQTVSTAREAGWIWDIGLTSRRGIGYAFSSAHTTEAHAEAVLRRYIEATGTPDPDSIEPRKISFRSGHRETFWHRNCVAVGLSAGFLEPLEASALVLIELSARMISEELPANRQSMDIVAKRFNERFSYRWDRIIDFLKLHYVLSKRDDSDFWVDNRTEETIPDSLAEFLELWRHQVPWHGDFVQFGEVFSAASYQYVLYGMGFETHVRRSRALASNERKAAQLIADNLKKTDMLASNLRPNRDLLAWINTQALPVA
ncbi:MAG: tryptophan 7-halogenase [Woeseiaceae bacterium]|nr:tryptophan 7-halogenase [Woeseiaceae bacterium]